MGRKQIKLRGGNKAVVYGRYSSKKQQAQSIEGQYAEAEKFAEHEDLQITNYFCDQAKTGREMSQRYGLLNMLEYLTLNTDIGYVIVYKLDRLSRNDKDRIEILDRLNKLGVVVLKTAEINGTGAAGYLSDGINSVLAVHYSWELAEKTKRGMATSARNATSTGTTPPYGYKWVDKKLVVDDTQAPIAQMIFRQYAEGYSKKQIADNLNNMGYVNKKGNEWSFKDFENLLKNRKYIGEWWYMGELANPHGNEPIIDIDTFNKVQNMLSLNKQQAGGKHRQKREYACSGKIYCMRCGAPMIAIGGVGRANNKYYYYSCRNAKCKECDKKNERQDIIDSWVVDEIIHQFNLTEDKIDNVALEMAKIYQQSADGGAIEIKRENLKQAEKEGEKLLAMMLKVEDSDILMNKFAETDKRIKSLKSEIQRLEIKGKMLPQVSEIKIWLQRLINEKEKATTSVRELINACVGRIYVDNDNRGVIIWQICSNTADEDSLEAVRKKENTYTEACIDANDIGSPAARLKEHFRLWIVDGKLCLLIHKSNL